MLSKLMYVPRWAIEIFFILVIVKMASFLRMLGTEEAVAVSFISKHVDTWGDVGIALSSTSEDGDTLAKVWSGPFHCMTDVSCCPGGALAATSFATIADTAGEWCSSTLCAMVRTVILAFFHQIVVVIRPSTTASTETKETDGSITIATIVVERSTTVCCIADTYDKACAKKSTDCGTCLGSVACTVGVS